MLQLVLAYGTQSVSIMAPKYPCGTCGKACGINTIECSRCLKWHHRLCCQMSPGMLREWSSADYTFLCPGCVSTPTPSGVSSIYDFKAALARLAATVDGPRDALLSAVKTERLLHRTYGVKPAPPKTDPPRGPTDTTAKRILALFHPVLLNDHTPLRVDGDGNCLYRAVRVNSEGPADRYRLLVGRPYTVGRKDCDITILNDQSISRKHAELTVNHTEASVAHPHKPPVLIIKELSKLGTVVGQQRIKTATAEVNSGDSLLFGTQGSSKYKAVYEPYNVTTSCLDVAAKKSVKKLVVQLGGHLVNDWRKDCQLLVMSSLSVTVKVICAMISQRDIVTPSYLDDLIKAIEAKAEEPDPGDYIPTLAESQLNPSEVSFKRDERRMTLLQGKIFVFIQPKQFKKLSMAIELAGGTPMLMEEGTDDNEDDILVGPSSCVMYCDTSDSTQTLSQNAHEWISHVEAVLKRHKKRFINDSEIGYAVLYCCTDKYCNPDKEVGGPSSAKPSLPSQTLSQHMEPPMSEMSDVVPRGRRSSGRKVQGNAPPQPTMHAIKEEVVSQPDTKEDSHGVSIGHGRAQPVAGTSRKRGRVEEQEEEEVLPKSKSAKRDVFEFRSQTSLEFKQEKVTPHKVVPAEAPKVTRSRRSMRSRGESRSPSPGPSTRGTEAEKQSPVSRSTRSRGKSPSPGGDDSSPVRQRGRGAKKTKSPVPSPKRHAPRVKHETVAEAEDPFDDLERIRPSRAKKSQLKGWDSEEEEEKQEMDNDPFADLDSVHTNRAASRGKVSARSKGKQPAPESDDWGGKVEVIEREQVGSPPPSPHQARNKELTDEAQPVVSHRLSNEEPLPGYLSTAQPQQGHGAVKSDYEMDESLPVKVMVTEQASLVVRKAGQARPAARPAGNSAMWNGRRVRNFKKFRKTQNTGADDLPHIIGGADLVAYSGTARKDKEEMFEEALQAESQHNEADRRARDLFDWEPSASRKRGRH